MSAIDDFVKGLKLRLQCSPKSFVRDGDDAFAHGDTESGFWADKVLDYDELCADIDAFAAEFQRKQEAA